MSLCEATAVQVPRRHPRLAVSGQASDRGEGTLTDTAELQDAFRPKGNVRFTLFAAQDASCRRRPTFSVLAPLDGADATTGALGPARPGRYQFVVRYEGDADNDATSTTCGENAVTVPGTTLVAARATPSGVAVTLDCLGGSAQARGCTGAIAVNRRQGAHLVPIGRRRYTISSGRTIVRRLALDPGGRRLLRSRRRVAAVVLVTFDHPSPELVARADLLLNGT